jgi:hypothetical protein
MFQKAQLLQGVLPFEGSGLDAPQALGELGTYQVPTDKRAQLVYFRAGNSLDELICVSLKRNGRLLRHFPLGAKASLHVPLAVVEELEPESVLEVVVAAPQGTRGTLVFDIGLVEVD